MRFRIGNAMALEELWRNLAKTLSGSYQQTYIVNELPFLACRKCSFPQPFLFNHTYKNQFFNREEQSARKLRARLRKIRTAERNIHRFGAGLIAP